MCFSASISFGASALLLGTGISAIKKTASPKMLAFASVPLLFGVQQLSEGVLWLTLPNPDLVSWHHVSIYIFLIFAQIIWPTWVSLSVWMMEKDRGRKKILSYFLILGLGLSAYLAYWIFTSEISALIIDRHIKYILDFPHRDVHVVLYLLATIAPIFISSLKRIRMFGWAIIGSLVLSYIFFSYYIISVWCFFAAVLSVLILFITAYNEEEQKTVFVSSKGSGSQKTEMR